MEPASNAPAFRETGEVDRLVSALTHLQHWWNQNQLNAWGLQRTSKSVRVACCDTALHGQEKTHELKLLPQEEKSGACIQHPRFSKGCLREWYGSLLTNDADKELAHLDIWWPLRARKRGQSVKLGDLKCYRKMPNGAKDYEFLKKKPVSLINKLVYTVPKKSHPSENGFKKTLILI